METRTIDNLCAHLDERGIAYKRDGNRIDAKGSLYLSSVTTLPENCALSAEGTLYLRSVTTEPQLYQGQSIRLRTIDHICTRLISSRDLGGGVALWTGQYFKGRLDTDQRCYVAQHGDVYAHGDSAATALRDLRFKIMQADLDPAELVADIKRSGIVRREHYRLLTGACESGLREGLIARGKAGDLDEMPLAEALNLCRGAYGGDQFRALLAQDEPARSQAGGE